MNNLYLFSVEWLLYINIERIFTSFISNELKYYICSFIFILTIMIVGMMAFEDTVEGIVVY